ncbi:MAG TPA: transposase [Thermomicrobiales bacterium]
MVGSGGLHACGDGVDGRLLEADFTLLEADFTLLLVNAQHIKAVPGRKTDARDCEWIADLLQHGLLRGSFVPSREQRELRELVRYRTALVRERADEVNRLQKTLEGANIKLASVATDIMGRSGRAMLAALIDGTTDPGTMATLAKGRLREKREELARALGGRIASHQRFMLVEQLSHIDTLEETIDRVSAGSLRAWSRARHNWRRSTRSRASASG